MRYLFSPSTSLINSILAIGVEDASAYSAEAVDLAMQLHHVLYPRLATNPQLHYVYTTIELPVREVLFKMERAGVLVSLSVGRTSSSSLVNN